MTTETKVDGNTSDGYHTFNELYEDRRMLFLMLCKQHRSKAWKSLLHSDGSMHDNYFICGIETPAGQFTYHYHIDHWDEFDVKELPNAPEWDGHDRTNIDRLFSLLNDMQPRTKVVGYSPLSEKQKTMMNVVKAKGNEFGELLAELEAEPEVNKEDLAEATRFIKTGLMWANRSIAKPTTFC